MNARFFPCTVSGNFAIANRPCGDLYERNLLLLNGSLNDCSGLFLQVAHKIRAAGISLDRADSVDGRMAPTGWVAKYSPASSMAGIAAKFPLDPRSSDRRDCQLQIMWSWRNEMQS